MVTRNIAVVIALLSGVAGAAPKAKPDPGTSTDVSAFKDRFVIWSDGKKHFIAMVMTSKTDTPIFWSSGGQSFWELRVRSGSSDGYDDALKKLERDFWDPRTRGGVGDLEYSGETKQLTLGCATRKTVMTQLPADEAKQLIAQAQFFKPRWTRYAYALVRDNTGKYFYVDNLREPEGAKNFRLFAGPKGALKPQKMLNVVSDSQGDIFSTARGELRLLLSKQDSTWIAREKPTKLVWVPVDDNAAMIYTDLGVYSGELFGTPCDDL